MIKISIGAEFKNGENIDYKDGSLKTALNYIGNLMANTGCSIEKVIVMNGLSDDLKVKVYEILKK